MRCILVSSFALISTRVNIIDRIIGAVGIQIKPVAPVGVLLGETANNRIVEPGPQVILLGDGINLLAVVGEAVEDGLLLGRDFAPGVVFVAIFDVSVFIDDMGG